MKESSLSSDPLTVLQRAVEGSYAVECELKRGGMGIVCLARDLQLDRPVAIKMLPPLAALDPVTRQRFVTEAKITASLSHPHILPVHAFDAREDCVFYVMAFVDGEDLETRVGRTGPMNVEEGVRVLREVAWALDYAHLRGIVHRDVKPGNIMLERGSNRALVMDFGIAQGPYERLTSPGVAVGTRGYASPEQMLGMEVDARTDIYGFGATAWYVFTGSHPVYQAHSDFNEMSLRTVVPAAPKEVERVIALCLSEQPGDRPASAGEVAEQMSDGLERTRVIQTPVKSWITAGRALTVPLLLLSVLPFLNHRWPQRLVNSWRAYLVTIGVPWLGLGLFRLGRTVHLMGQGYNVNDVRASLGQWKRSRNASLEVDHRRVPYKRSRAVRLATFVALGLSIVVAGAWGWERMPWALAPITFNLLFLGVVLGWIWPRWAPPKQDYLASMRVRFWNSPFGGWLAEWATRLSRLGRRADREPIPLRHTEIALRVRVEQLHAELEPAIRNRLEELPATAARLEQLALEAREAMERLHALQSSLTLSPTGVTVPEQIRIVDEMSQRHARLEERHRRLILALERLRLGLLRLAARVETPDGLTTSLKEAEEYTELLDLLREAQRTLADSTSAVDRT